MKLAAPHFLLLAEAAIPTDRSSAQGGWRFVLQSLDAGITIEAEDQEALADQNRLQLLAVVRGLEALDQPSQVTLVTSSRYVQRGMHFGLREWRHNGWQWECFGRMRPIKNADLWKRIDQALCYHEIRCRCLRFGSLEAVVDSPSHEATCTPTSPRVASRREPSQRWSRWRRQSWVALRKMAQLGRGVPGRAAALGAGVWTSGSCSVH